MSASMADDGGSWFVVQRVRDIDVIEFTNDALLDQANIERMGDELVRLVERAGHPKLVISFSNVQSVSSAVLGVLIATHKKVKNLKGELRLASISERIIEVFKLTRLDKMLKIYKTTDEALLRF